VTTMVNRHAPPVDADPGAETVPPLGAGGPDPLSEGA